MVVFVASTKLVVRFLSAQATWPSIHYSLSLQLQMCVHVCVHTCVLTPLSSSALGTSKQHKVVSCSFAPSWWCWLIWNTMALKREGRLEGHQKTLALPKTIWFQPEMNYLKVQIHSSKQDAWLVKFWASELQIQPKLAHSQAPPQHPFADDLSGRGAPEIPHPCPLLADSSSHGSNLTFLCLRKEHLLQWAGKEQAFFYKPTAHWLAGGETIGSINDAQGFLPCGFMQTIQCVFWCRRYNVLASLFWAGMWVWQHRQLLGGNLLLSHFGFAHSELRITLSWRISKGPCYTFIGTTWNNNNRIQFFYCYKCFSCDYNPNTVPIQFTVTFFFWNKLLLIESWKTFWYRLQDTIGEDCSDVKFIVMMENSD